MLERDQIFQNINLGLMVLDRDLTVRGWNRWMEMHTAIGFEEICGKSLLEFYPHLAEPEYSRFFKSVLSFGNYAFFSQKLHKQLIPMKNPHHSAAHFPFMQQNCTAGPIRDEKGAIVSIFITLQDVTEYVMYEYKLVEMSRLDPMTKLLNRSQLDLVLQEEMDRSRRYGKALCVVMIDIDFFKSVNDSYGHVCGDQVIMGIASLLKETVRRIDVVGRYGGEEFCCVLPETRAENGCVLAERLRELVEQTAFAAGAENLKVTISLGVAELSPAVDTLEELIKSADDALYASKRNGRNRVTCSGECGRDGEMPGKETTPREPGERREAPARTG